MKTINLKSMLKVSKIETAKVRGNVLFGCNKCNNQWNADDYPNSEKFKEGLNCPSCSSKNIMAL